MTLFQIVPYIRILLLSICCGTVGAAYFPNFGFAGCYLYDSQMENFSNFSQTEVEVSTTPESSTIILCFKECLNNPSKYAGLKLTNKENYHCFCGDSYNQTFAVDENMCSKGEIKYMKIYNTDYDIKPLLSVPGNRSNIVEAWNTVGCNAMFVNNVMRNTAIDWWNTKRLYYTPEYVKILALNKYGQELWAMEFFTNKSTADITKWLSIENVLDQKISMNIFVDMRKMVVQPSNATNKYFFLQENIEEDGSRVTVVSKDHTPLPITRKSTYNGNGKKCNCLGFLWIQGKHHINCSTLELNRLHKLPHKDAIAYFPILLDEESVTRCFEKCGSYSSYILENKTCVCLKEDNYCEAILFNTGRNYGMDRAALERKNISELKSDGQYICGAEVSQNCSVDSARSIQFHGVLELDSCIFGSLEESITCDQPRITRYTVNDQCECLNGTPPFIQCSQQLIYSNEVSSSCNLTIKQEPYTTSMKNIIVKMNVLNVRPSLGCIDTAWTEHIQCDSLNEIIYTVKDDALLLADRVVILGYYHKEEPKVSKWEFLNDFSIEEIQNIMRPVLQKVQSQGSVPVRNLSSSVRKKESATDMRMSSQGIGILGGCLLGLVFLIIFVSDLVIIKVQLTALFKNLSRLCKTNNPRRISDFGEK